MRTLMIATAAAVLLAAPTSPAFAIPGHSGAHGGPQSSAPTGTTSDTSTTAPTTTTATRSPAHDTGQPGAECGSATAPNRPGQAENAPGSAFNPDGTAGQNYAGEQPQNSRNIASVSQYDAACAHQPTH